VGRGGREAPVIDFAADLAAIHAAEDLPLVAGSFTNPGGEAVAFTDAQVEDLDRQPDGGQKDVETQTLRVLSEGIATAPVRDARVAVTGDARAWVAVTVEPIAPGGVVIGWRLALKTWTNLDEED
jgi:hypothetical protein